MSASTIIKVAVSKPLRYTLDYRIQTQTVPAVGSRVQVPFRRGQLIGIVHQIANSSDFDITKIKSVDNCLDDEALISTDIMNLCNWASAYYHHPIGEVLQCALPKLLRDGNAVALPVERYWQIDQQVEMKPSPRAAKQVALYEYLASQAVPIKEADLLAQGFSREIIQKLAHTGIIFFEEKAQLLASNNDVTPALTLNDEQAAAVRAISASTAFQTFLLDGITGSGKTEVYLQVIAKCLEEGKQCLVLIPEIGLTPQTLSRFAKRFSVPIAIMHSNLNDRERMHAWLYAKRNEARIVIGTRSAIFTPMPDLGLIIVDEEHDSSFKQQDTFRYSARDLAIVRAQHAGIPVVLGTATPSLGIL